ncbi:aromatic-ring-hydroxylating dioxygenase subunit beta [Rhizohabitans arisaemae]|uniref:aromatic-ring-hydroxylating dioxygenase subunit beta n=1 Tax=Rhizohabitans arisaemae TaxID=2720610 RepID=UPI0024B2359A|nr:aromatic-ring-hydroxylating dioxygenase subunit beta [Rhizohabitans arisaemae]
MTVRYGHGAVQVGARTVVRSEVEDFLYAEADILDSWHYDAWLALFVEGARYEIPTTDYRGGWSPHESGSFVTDDWDLLRARVKRLKSRKAHAENPPSRTHRLVSNVRLFPGDDDDSFRVTASFVVHRARDGRFDVYVGRYEHILAVEDDGFRFRLRRSVLGHEALPVGARLSFIL